MLLGEILRERRLGNTQPKSLGLYIAERALTLLHEVDSKYRKKHV